MGTDRGVKNLTAPTKKNVAFVLDESRSKSSLFRHVEQFFKTIGAPVSVEILSSETSEDRLLEMIKKKHYSLVMVPWRNYFTWTKAEAQLGGNNPGTGSFFAGYFTENLRHSDLPRTLLRHSRLLLFDFHKMSSVEIFLMILALLDEQKHTGIKPLLSRRSQIYCETWFGRGDPYHRSEVLLSLPKIAHTKWMERANSLRICTLALWSLIYENGPGKGELAQNLVNKAPRAFFQVGVDHRSLVLRLCFTIPNFSTIDAINSIWPTHLPSSHPSQILSRFADFIRIHRVADTSGDLELVVGFSKSRPAEASGETFKTLWISNVLPDRVVEPPYRIEGRVDPMLKPFPEVVHEGNVIRYNSRMALHPEQKLKRLQEELLQARNQLSEANQKIAEMRRGGVSAGPPTSFNEPDAIIEALQAREQEFRFELNSLQLELQEGMAQSLNQIGLERIRRRIQDVKKAEASWKRKLSQYFDTLNWAINRKARGG